MLKQKIKLNFFSFILLLIAIIAPTIVIVNKIMTNSEKSNTEMIVDTSNIIITKTFPETLDSLINATGKKDYITIPMPTKYYNYNFKDDSTNNLNFNRVKLKNVFEVSKVITKDDVTLVTLNTNVEESIIDINEQNSVFSYKYNISNGYVLSTKLSILIYEPNNLKIQDKKIDFLKRTFDDYLIKKGFEKKFTFFNNENSIEYISDSKIVKIKISGFVDYRLIDSFEIIMLDKYTEANKEKINETSFKKEYKELEKILK